ncbi:MAG: Crp/Fnr family transcriptional regulator [Candidatus Limisoma sp.]
MSRKKSPISLPIDNCDRPLKFIDDLRRVFRITADEERMIREHLTYKIYPKGYVIDGTNEILQNRFYLIKGVARTYYIYKGREYNYSFSLSEQFVLPPLTVHGKGEKIFIQFVTETELCYITPRPSAHENLPLLETREFMSFVNLALIEQIQYMEDVTYMLRLEAADRYKWVLEKYPQILETVSLTQLASFLNITKETLYRIRSGKY